ncbi:MAG: hypothetical protein RI911_781 [Candidatus Parcubacteria bacterium]|jgi:hypothetical protein
MELNYLAILVAAFVQFVLGALWYSPVLFGKQWMEIMGVSHLSMEEIQKMQKEMGPFYAVQFALTVVYTISLACVIAAWPESFGMLAAVKIWAGFVVPTQISGVIWGATKKEHWLKQILIMISYQLVGILIAAYILSVM